MTKNVSVFFVCCIIHLSLLMPVEYQLKKFSGLTATIFVKKIILFIGVFNVISSW